MGLGFTLVRDKPCAMILKKSSFFLLLSGLYFSPFLIYKVLWIIRSERTTALMSFHGKSQTGALEHHYSAIGFEAGGDTIWFNGNDNIFFKEGEKIPVRYLKSNPNEARLDIFSSMWGDTLVYGVIPLSILVVLFLHPHIFPRGTRVRLSRARPFVRAIPPVTA